MHGHHGGAHPWCLQVVATAVDGSVALGDRRASSFAERRAALVESKRTE